ncbi:MAG: DMT family transporter [Acidaminococcaceae bacterium]|nr:DMT family transporter [Acidaminococcaceae bacterium]
MHIDIIKGTVLILIAASAWGLGGVAGQYLFNNYGTDAVWLVMVRQIMAGVIFLFYSAAVKKENIFRLPQICPSDILKFSFIGILGAQLGFYYTIALCNAATATVLQYTAPIYIMLWMAWRKKKMPELREIIGICGAMTGVFLISTHGRSDSLAISPAALVVGIISALTYAYYTVMPVEMLQRFSTTTVIGWGQLLSGVFLILWRNPFTIYGTWDIYAAAALTYLLFGATILSYAMYLSGLQIIGPTKASLISCAEPLASIIFMVLLLGTELTWPDLFGMGAIILTVALLSLPKK